MPAPTFVASYGPANWTTSTDTITASVTVAAGDFLVIYGGIHNGGVEHTSISGGGLTYTLRTSAHGSGTTSWCSSEIWTAPCPSAQTFTLSLTKATSTALHGFRALRFANVASVLHSASAFGNNVAGMGAEVELVVAPNTANMTSVWFSSDWDGTAGTRTFFDTFTELSYYQASQWMLSGGYYADISVGATGTRVLGMSAPTGQKFTASMVTLEGSTPASVAAAATGALSLNGSATATGTTPPVARSASGSLTLSGTANPSGASSTGESTHFMLISGSWVAQEVSLL